MARRLAKALVRKFEAMQDSRWLRPFARYIAHPSLWSLNRRSVALAVAAGMIGGLIPGPFQMITAGLIAMVARCNFPIALVVTLYSNPLTIVPLYLVAYKLGSVVSSAHAAPTLVAPPHFLGLVKKELTSELAKHLMATVDKDLSDLAVPALTERLRDVVRIPLNELEG